ncbi:MAG: glycoside hydrolase [Muribaculaceae bacterium]|nr:glycoside hydrolase [Muribaculaceae bacterium]
MKPLYILALCSLIGSSAATGRTVSYARANQNVTFDLNWGPDNYGSIAWQTSADNGNTWTDIAGATKPVYTVRASGPALYRAVITGDPACPPIIEEREIRTLSINATVLSSGADYTELEVSVPDLQGAEVVEYGFTSALQGVGRTYTILPRNKVGDALPEMTDGSFIMTCSGLLPDTQYSIRPYFITADGSVIFGAGKLATTIGGLKFETEDWIIEKTSVQVPFAIPGFPGGNPSVEFWFGPDRNSLQKYEVENLGDYRYRSQLIDGLTPGTTYTAVVKARIDGDIVEIEKPVTTWSDYSGYTVDNTVKPVSHVVEWNKDNLVCLTPETLQVEYPRMCRIDDNKILLTYHGGVSDHWQNSYLRKSYDNGRTWTEPVEIYNILNSFHGCKYYRICNPEMTKLANGWIILTVVANGNPEGNNNSKVLACLSKDGGETWGDPIIVGRGRTWEPQVIQLPNGEIELLVSSETKWWETQRDNMFQEILSTRSTDNGETWTTYKRASYKPGARDGMPVAVVMQGNKGVLFIEESVNGNIPPSLQHRTLDGEWDTADWDGVQDSQRWLTSLNNHAGAPYMIQLPTGEFLIMAHTNQTGSVWQTNRPQVIMADNTGHNFKYSRVPLAGSVLPSECGAYYNSFFLYDNDTVWLLFTKAQYKGNTRVESDVMVLEGKIVEK